MSGTSIQNNEVEYLYKPDISQNISTLLKNVPKLDDLTLPNDCFIEDKLFKIAKWDSSEGTALADLENQLKILSNHKRQSNLNFYRDPFRGLSIFGLFGSADTIYFLI